MPPCLDVASVPQGVVTGRLWISLKKPVYFHIASSTEFTQPDPTNPTDVNNNTIWDFFEANASYVENGGTYDIRAHANTSNVDYTTMPQVYELYNGTTLIGGPVGLNHTRTTLYGAMSAIPLLKPLMYKPFRVLAPGHGQSINPNGLYYFPANYFDSYVDYCWTHWTTNTLDFTYSGIVWSGQVTDNVLTLSGTVSGATEVHHIGKPASQDVFLCNGVFNGNGDQWGNTLQVYDQASNSWSNQAPLSTVRSSMAAGVINGKLYVAGGKTPISGIVVPCQPVNVLEIYDPATNTWTTKTPMPTARQEAGAGVIDGKLYVVGGQNQDTGGWLNVLEVYDPSNNTWTTKATMPTARRGLAVAALEGKLYAIGGEGTAGVLKTVEVYDPVADLWTNSTPLQLPKLSPMCAVSNGVLYVAGGMNDQYKITGDLWSYTSAAGWTTKAAMPLSVSNSQAVAINGKLYIASGLIGPNSTTNQVLFYDPASNIWHSDTVNPPAPLLAHIPTQVYNYGGGAIGNMLYAAGGVQYNVSRFTRDAALKNQVASALNRSVMHLPPYKDSSVRGEFPWGDWTSTYYVNNVHPELTPPVVAVPDNVFKTNLYSHVLHQQAINGLIYGFAYDDNNKQSSYVDNPTGTATEIRLTINNCNFWSSGYLLPLLLD